MTFGQEDSEDYRKSLTDRTARKVLNIRYHTVVILCPVHVVVLGNPQLMIGKGVGDSLINEL